MKNQSVLISGASIAGPAIAYWLDRAGFRTTVVERAPALRQGGHAVDFRGPAHMGVLEKMGLLERIRSMQTHPGDLGLVDAAGRRLATLPAKFTAGEVEIQRGDLSRILFDATRGSTEYVFGDHATSLVEDAGGVEVTFARGAPRRFDLVVGADGLHSGVRALAFGDESRFIRFHGYYVAACSGPDLLGLESSARLYSEPGRAVSVGGARLRGEAATTFIFASEPLDYRRHDVAQQKQIVSERYAGMGWETPRLIEAMQGASELYFDSISHVELPTYSRGRVVLLGDAGYGGTIGGQGTGLAIVCAYVLAGELAAAGGDHRAAFARYEATIRDYARGCQEGSRRVGEFFAPPTRARTWLRNTLYAALTSRPLVGFFEKLITSSASSIDLPRYALA